MSIVRTSTGTLQRSDDEEYSVAGLTQINGADTYFYPQGNGVQEVAAGGVAPIITSSASQSVAENTPVSITLTADQEVTWSIVGGPDAALFDISSQSIVGGSFDFEAPADAGANNVYNFTIRATNATGQYADQAFTLTVNDVAEPAQRVTNGNFAGGTTGWNGFGFSGKSVSGGKAVFNNTGAFDGINQSVTLVAGKYYELSYVFNRTAGTLRPQLAGGTPVDATDRSASGTFVQRLLAATGNNLITFQASSGPLTGDLDDISLIGPYNTATVGGA